VYPDYFPTQTSRVEGGDVFARHHRSAAVERHIQDYFIADGWTDRSVVVFSTVNATCLFGKDLHIASRG
jgi:hypothetical protein